MAMAKAVDAALAAYRDYQEALVGLADARKAADGQPNPDIDALNSNAKRRQETFLAAYQDAMEKIEKVNGLIDDIMDDENWSVVSVTDEDDDDMGVLSDDDDDMVVLSDDDADMGPKEADDAAAVAKADKMVSPSEDKKTE